MLGEWGVKRQPVAILLVGVAVGLNLISAAVLKEAADMHNASHWLIIALIAIVFLINMLRVLFWAAIHKRFRLSDSYPLTSVFFPMILVLSALYGEKIGLAKLIGTALITLGVLLLMDSKAPDGKGVETAKSSS